MPRLSLVENNLRNQAIVVDRLDFEYEIPGSRIGVPAHSSSVGIRVNPADADPETSPSPFGPPNVYIGLPEAQIVPASLVLFLRQNRQALPQLPYTMIVKMTAHARTDAGQGLDSNEVRYTITWEQDLRQAQLLSSTERIRTKIGNLQKRKQHFAMQ